MTYKPVILLGQGVRSNPALVEHLRGLGIPILLTFMAIDLLGEDDPVYCGRPGLVGQRAANIILQKADEVFVYGARLDPGTAGYSLDNFAPRATVHVYDVDPAELAKFPRRFNVDQVDLRNYDLQLMDGARPDWGDWLTWCKDLYRRFRPELDGKLAREGYIDPHLFLSALSDACSPDDVIAPCSSGMTAETFMQAWKVKRGQSIHNLSTIGAMGAGVPMAIGAAIATGRRVIAVDGDGGFMLNSQELEVARRLSLPITWFVWNNGGYSSIRNMQRTRFDGRRVGCDEASGLTLPKIQYIAEAYGIEYWQFSQRWFDIQDSWINNFDPAIVEVMIDPDWVQYPRVAASLIDGKYYPDPLHKMTPYLPDEELDEIMRWGE